MRPINRFLLDNNIRISHNPCISPDFCLDWPALRAKLEGRRRVKERPKSRFETAAGTLDAPRRRDDVRLRVEAAAARAWNAAATRWRTASRSATAPSRFPRRGTTCFG